MPWETVTYEPSNGVVVCSSEELFWKLDVECYIFKRYYLFVVDAQFWKVVIHI